MFLPQNHYIFSIFSWWNHHFEHFSSIFGASWLLRCVGLVRLRSAHCGRLGTKGCGHDAAGGGGEAATWWGQRGDSRGEMEGDHGDLKIHRLGIFLKMGILEKSILELGLYYYIELEFFQWEYWISIIIWGFSNMAMDQYLLIPFLGRWTSINPSYFDVNYRGTIGFDTLPYWFLKMVLEKGDLNHQRDHG